MTSAHGWMPDADIVGLDKKDGGERSCASLSFRNPGLRRLEVLPDFWAYTAYRKAGVLLSFRIPSLCLTPFFSGAQTGMLLAFRACRFAASWGERAGSGRFLLVYLYIFLG